MNVAVTIPYRPRDAGRIANLERSRQMWDELGWPVYLGDHPGDPFCRGHAVNNAVAQAPDADVYIIPDVDFVLADTAQVVRGAETALRDECYVVCYSVMEVLNQEGTEAIRAGSWDLRDNIIESVALIWGGMNACPRVLFERVCGFDERFSGWGAEDIAFLVSVSTMGGRKQRMEGTAYHMTHPENTERETFLENKALSSRYLDCDGNPECMRQILAERGCQ